MNFCFLRDSGLLQHEENQYEKCKIRVLFLNIGICVYGVLQEIECCWAGHRNIHWILPQVYERTAD